MSPAASSSESSLLLWFLAALVYWLAAHVLLGALRDARRPPGPSLRAMRRPVLVAGLALGTALCTGIVLSLSSLGLSLRLGFRADAAAALWLGAALAGVLLAAGLAWRRERWAWAAGGLAIGLLAAGVQAGWVAAAGFRPGVVWSGKFLAAAALLMAAGASAALALALGEDAQQGRLRGRWRLAGSLVLGLAWVVGQEVLLAGVSLGAQVGSAYRQQLTAPLLSVVAGTLVPLALLVAAFDQAQRRRQRRREGRQRPGRAGPSERAGTSRRAGRRTRRPTLPPGAAPVAALPARLPGSSISQP